MALSLSSIDSLLKPQAAAGTIVLEASLFDDEATIKTALAINFLDTKGKVTIKSVTAYELDTAAGRITFAGVGVGGSLDGMTIGEVSIKVDTSTPSQPVPQLALEATPPSNWTLKESFPSLTSDPAKAIGFQSANPPDEPQSPQLFWANYTSTADRTEEGYFFQGMLDLVAPYDFLDLFLGSSSTPWISGSIRMVGATNLKTNYAEYHPSATLRADVNTTPVSVGPLSLEKVQVGLNISPSYNQVAKTFLTHSSLSVSSNLMFMGAAIGLSVKIEDPGSPILFTANLAGAFKAGISDLSKLVFGEGSSSQLGVPGFSLSDPNAITLEDIIFSYTPTGANKGLNSITVDMGTPPNQEWEIWDSVNLKDILVKFQVMPAMEGGKTAFAGSFSGIVEDWLSINASFSHTSSGNAYSFYGGLAKPVSITQVVSFFAGETISELPQLEVSTLDVAVTKTAQKSFGFDGGISIDGDWEIISSPLPIKLRGLLFHLTRTPGTGANTTNAVKAGGMLDIGDYQFSVKADYSTGNGWQFIGDMTLIGTDATGDTFGAALQKFFGFNEPLPGIIEDWYIENIHVEFNTKPGNFTFTCQLGNTDYPTLELEFDFILTNGGTYSVDFSGILTYSTTKFDLQFKLEIDVEGKSPDKTTTITASYDAQTPATLSEFLEAISADLSFDADIPAALEIDADLKSLIFKTIKKDRDPLNVEAAGLFQLLINGSTWDLYLSYSNDTHFESNGADSRANGAKGKPAYVFGLSFSGSIGLGDLPLVGNIPGVGDLKIDKLGFYYTDAVFTSSLKKLVFDVAELDESTKLAPDPDSAFLSQPKFSLMALLGNQKESSPTPNTMPLGSSTGTPASGTQPTFAKKQADPRAPITWLSINKTLGPVDLIKIGLGYEKPSEGQTGELGIVGIYVTGAFTIAGLSMVLDRLGITFPIPKPGGTIKNPLSEIGFHLGGMFLEYKQPSLEIAGGFVNLPGGSLNMIGEFIVEAGPYGLQGYGGYSDELGHPSLFLFLNLQAPIGGPPFFFVNGISGGFGVNRGFTLPTFEELSTYPLLPSQTTIPTASSLGDKTQEEKLEAMTQSLLSLAKYFPVEDGEYWFALGLDVTSFEMIDVTAILSVAFGVDLQIAVIGSASMTMPVKEPAPIAYVQINFEVSYSSSNGMLAVMGAITPSSFIYEGLVHISGGFAFNTWFSGPHSGDFVLTIGGYNSHYNRPDFYPNVPRMELRAGIDIVNMVGDAYFALVPHALMAGLDIKATADLGPISAWFDAGVDFFIGWKPLHYEAEAHIQIGASFTIDLGFVKTKITIHVGVGLEIWGPKFGGKARVDLDIISFTIGFGADPEPAPALGWSEFQDFLPSVPAPSKPQATDSPMAMDVAIGGGAPAAAPPDEEKPHVNILVKEGLAKEFPKGHEVDGLNWIVDPNHFDIRTHSTAPCTQVVFNTKPLPVDYPYFSPEKLREQINNAQHRTQEPPFFVNTTPDGATKWDDIKFGIPPMKLTDIKSIHTVTLQRLPLSAPTPVKDVIITLGKDGVPPSLWGNQPIKKGTVISKETVIKNALVQLRITPMLWFPKRTTFIPYYSLVFNTNNLFLEQDTAPAINTAKFANPTEIYRGMDDGTVFTATNDVRTKITSELKDLGFANLNLENSNHLSTQDYVSDPMLTYMSSTSETNFGS